MHRLPAYSEDPGLVDIGVIACDMDLTLLATNKAMPAGIHERIDALAALGIPFCPASGRALSSLEALFAGQKDRMGFIADNGGLVTCFGQVVFRDLLAPAVYREVCRTCLEEVPGAVPVVCAFERAYALKRHREHAATLGIYYPDIVWLDSFDGLDAEADKATILFPAFDSRRWFDAVFNPRFGRSLSVAVSGGEWVDFMNRGIDKGVGLAHLCEHLGVPLAQAAAFGDADNDAQMLEAAGHGFLMANAEPHMRAHANYLAPANEEAGVLRVIDAILAAKGAA